MRQDRKINGWIFISSVLQLIAGLVFIVLGATTSVFGFLKPEKLTAFKDVNFFINQEGIIKLQQNIFNNKVLKDGYMYLVLGIIVAVIGLLALIFACVEINYAKKRKVVRHKVALLMFTLIPLSVAICASIYLVLEFNALSNNIKYVAYGVIGVFGVISLFNILGIIVNRSEQFMSNDNNKYAFDNSSLRNARVAVNNNIRGTQVERAPQQRLISNQARNVQPQMARPQNLAQSRPQGVMPQRPQGVSQQRMQPHPQASNMQQHPQTSMMQARPTGQSVQRSTNMQPHPAQVNRPQSTARPVSSSQVTPRPVRPASQTMPSNTTLPKQASQSPKYCVRCGKLLGANETICSVCGSKV